MAASYLFDGKIAATVGYPRQYSGLQHCWATAERLPALVRHIGIVSASGLDGTKGVRGGRRSRSDEILRSYHRSTDPLARWI